MKTCPRLSLLSASLTAALAVGVALLLAGCGQPASPAGDASGAAPAPGGATLTKLRFQTDWYPQAEHGGFYQALAKGYYREAGLDVDILPGGPGPNIGQKLIGGGAELGIGRVDDLIVNVANGLPWALVGVFMQHDPQAILLHDDSPVRTFADLQGRNIMAVPGSNWMNYVKARHGITFNVIPLNYGLAQFMSDKAFIQQCFITNEPYFVAKNGGKARALLLADTGFDPYRVMFTTQRYARENEAVVRAFVAASIRGWADFMTGDPSPAKKLIGERNKEMSQEFMDYSIASMKDYHLIDGHADRGERTGAFSRSRVQGQVDTLVELKLIPATVPLEKFVRFDLMPPEVVLP